MERYFVHYNRAWYSKAPNSPTYDWEDSITFLVEDDDKTYEFIVAWYKIGRYYSTSPKFECYDDAWDGLKYIEDVFTEMAKLKNNISPLKFCEMLVKLEFEDNTMEKEPEK